MLKTIAWVVLLRAFGAAPLLPISRRCCSTRALHPVPASLAAVYNAHSGRQKASGAPAAVPSWRRTSLVHSTHPTSALCTLQEDQERSELMQRLERMQPTVAWMNPLVNDATSPAEVASMAAPPATGEESTEAAAAAARRQQARRAASDSRGRPKGRAEAAWVLVHASVRCATAQPAW